jgi:hypothetical protein
MFNRKGEEVEKGNKEEIPYPVVLSFLSKSTALVF